MLPNTFLDSAKEYIAIDTSIQSGNCAILPFIKRLLAPLNAHIDIQKVRFLDKDHINILASFGTHEKQKEEGGLLLVTHSDTVPPGPLQSWTQTNPFVLKIAQDKVFGLGVADVKLDFLCKIFAMYQIDYTQLKKPVRLLATCAEEVGLVGAKAYIASDLPKPQWVLCGEPSQLVACHAHKGYAVAKITLQLKNKQPLKIKKNNHCYRITARGKAAHSSTPHLGVHAILKMFEFLHNYPNLNILNIAGGTSSNTVPAHCEAIVASDIAINPNEFVDSSILVESILNSDLSSNNEHKSDEQIDISSLIQMTRSLWQTWLDVCSKLQPQTDNEFDPNHVVQNLGVIQFENNILTALFDARLLPQHNPKEMILAFEEKALEAINRNMDLQISVERDNPGMRASDDSFLLQSLSAVLSKLQLPHLPKAKPTSTEAGVFARAGYDALVLGPGVSIGNAHTANEWNSLTDLEKAIEIYKNLIETMCC